MKTITFPEGFDITICTKHDILETLDKNVVDKEIMYDLIKSLECNIAKCIRENRWAGMPFIGSVRPSPVKAMFYEPEVRETLKDAYATMPFPSFIMFKKAMIKDKYLEVVYNRQYKVIAAINARRNYRYYRRLCKTRGDVYARIFMFSCASFVGFDVGRFDEDCIDYDQ
nr:MAG TPA: DNA binding protein [Crassvirales sp.]